MPVITLPDGSKREFDHPVTLMQVAEDIGPGLAKATVCGRINGQLALSVVAPTTGHMSVSVNRK